MSALGPHTERALARVGEQGVAVLAPMRAALAAYATLLLDWNRRVNLTAARRLEDLDSHLADCLYVAPHVPAAGTLIDVGSGGGLPALVIAIVRPQLRITSLEPTHKKHAFLRTAARALALSDRFDPRPERVEDHSQRNFYDAASSRATFDVVEWLGLGLSLVRPGGKVIAMEATPRDDLPADAVRHPVELEGKTRAVVTLTRRDEGRP